MKKEKQPAAHKRVKRLDRCKQQREIVELTMYHLRNAQELWDGMTLKMQKEVLWKVATTMHVQPEPLSMPTKLPSPSP